MRDSRTMTGPFTDRRDGGRRLAVVLQERDWIDPVVLGLARGGVPVAAEVAAGLGAPLGVAVARKIGAPGHPEFGIGAVTASGAATFDQHSIDALRIGAEEWDRACADERVEAQRRVELYQQDVPPPPLAQRDVIVIDDGLATGVTATAALRALREEGPRTLVLAAPVCAAEAAGSLRREADDVVCVSVPERFAAVGEWYHEFGQTSDDEVIALLRRQHA